MNKQLAKTKKKKGFTLIELVVVIAILGILAAILVPVISNFIENANQRTDNANARMLYTAAAMYYSVNSNDVTDGQTLGETELAEYIGAEFPTVRAAKFGGPAGIFTVTLTADAEGVIEIVVDAEGNEYDPSQGIIVVAP